MRLSATVTSAKIAQKLLSTLRSGGGALPGRIAESLYKDVLRELSSQLKHEIILIAGTNGKTTTSRLLASILEKSGKNIVYNRSGSNMNRGHISAFLEKSSWTGKVHADIALLEVDEAVLPETLRQTKPRLVIWGNLFRDQLDRYGEVDSIAQKWSEAVKKYLPPESLLLVNADDPNLVYAAQQSGHKNIHYYGLNDPGVGTDIPSSAVDVLTSPASQELLTYSVYYVSHLGEYRDSKGTFSRPKLQYAATHIHLSSEERPSTFQLNEASYTLPLPGLYNIYNALAAGAAALTLSIEVPFIQQAVSLFQGAFGRFERLKVDDQELVLALIKNPVGATEVLRTIAQATEPFSLAIFANDNFADGLDVSWYWDTAFEVIVNRPTHLLLAGTRAEDMALRWKYAGYTGTMQLEKDIRSALQDIVLSRGIKRTYILATYTATLESQRALRKLGIKSNHWQE